MTKKEIKIPSKEWLRAQIFNALNGRPELTVSPFQISIVVANHITDDPVTVTQAIPTKQELRKVIWVALGGGDGWFTTPENIATVAASAVRQFLKKRERES